MRDKILNLVLFNILEIALLSMSNNLHGLLKCYPSIVKVTQRKLDFLARIIRKL